MDAESSECGGRTDASAGVSLVDEWWDVVVVGAGLSGAVLAERFAASGYRVLVLEKRDHIGGNCYDYIDSETGIRVNKYGAHIFHTEMEHVWEYVQRFRSACNPNARWRVSPAGSHCSACVFRSEWTPYEHQVLANVGGVEVPVPVNIATVNTLFGAEISSPAEMDAWLDAERAASSPAHAAAPQDSAPAAAANARRAEMEGAASNA